MKNKELKKIGILCGIIGLVLGIIIFIFYPRIKLTKNDIV